MKKFMSIVLSAVVLMSIAVGTAFAETASVSSKTGMDADAGNAGYTISGTGEGLKIWVKVTDVSETEESALQNAHSLSAYANAQVVDTAAKLLGASAANITVNELKQLQVSGYESSMGSVTISAPFAALPAKGTHVAVMLKIVNRNGSVNWVTVPGVVEEKVLPGNTKVVPCVTFTLDEVTMLNVQAGTATIGNVLAK